MDEKTLDAIDALSKTVYFQCFESFVYGYNLMCVQAPLMPVVKFLKKNSFLLLDNFDFIEILVSTFFQFNRSSTINDIVMNVKRLELFLLGLGICQENRKIWLKSQVFRRDWSFNEKERLMLYPGGFAQFLMDQSKYAMKWCNGFLPAWLYYKGIDPNPHHILERFLSTETNTSTRRVSALPGQYNEKVFNRDGKWINFETEYDNEASVLLKAWRKVLHYATLACAKGVHRIPFCLSLYNAIGDYLCILSIPCLLFALDDESKIYDKFLEKTQEMFHLAGLCAHGSSDMIRDMMWGWYMRECLGLDANHPKREFPPWAIGGCFGYERYEVDGDMYPIWLSYADTHVNDFVFRATRHLSNVRIGYRREGATLDRYDGGRIWVFVHRDIEVKYGMIGDPNMTILVHGFIIRCVNQNTYPVQQSPCPFRDYFGNFYECSYIYTAPEFCSIQSKDTVDWVTIDGSGVQRNQQYFYRDLKSMRATGTPAWFIAWNNSFYRGGFNSMTTNIRGIIPRTYQQLAGGGNRTFWYMMQDFGDEEWQKFFFMFATLVLVAREGVSLLGPEKIITSRFMYMYGNDYMNSAMIEYSFSCLPIEISNEWARFVNVVDKSMTKFCMEKFWTYKTVAAFREDATATMVTDPEDISWFQTPTPIRSFNL